MRERSLSIPIVVDESGALLWVEETVKGGVYRCPACQELLIRKAGTMKVLHFAHDRETPCNAETALHAAAKQTVLEAVSSWLEGKTDAPVLVGKCMGVEVGVSDERHAWGDGWSCSAEIEWQLNGGRVDGCRAEVELPNGLRPDLILFRSGEPVLAIEIKVTHEVDAQKGARLGMGWIELDAEAVIRHPREWRPLQHNIGKLQRCRFCIQVDSARMAKFIEEDLWQWGSWWKSKYGKSPYVIDQIGHRRRTLIKLVNSEIESWTLLTGEAIPGRIHFME